MMWSFGCTRRVSPQGSPTGRERGPTALVATGPRPFQGTRYQGSSPLGYGTTGFTVGQRVFGLTAWQALFDHGHLKAGQTVLIHGAAGAVGSTAVQLALEAGARVIGSGRAPQREAVLGLKAHAFLDMQRDRLEDVGEVDLVLDVIGGEILDRSAKLVRSGDTLVTIAEPPRVRPDNARAILFVVEPDRAHLAALELRLRDGQLRPIIGAVYPLAEAVSAFDPAHRTGGKTIIRVTEDA
jgi:NADPH:quinone reductase-like Zn-dependent oxidoreductase